MKKLVSLAVLTALLAACAETTKTSEYGSDGFGEETLATETLNDTYLMAAAPRYYIGNAYKVEDVQYIPTEDLTYNQTGMAGIIPTELNGTKTSNGETYDMAQMVATSKTLPLPTIAKVTNLENGQAVTVRVNNRGPFVNTRIMDLSPAAAAKIGLTNQSKVQVQVLPEQSIAVKNATIGEKTTTVVEEETTVATQPASAATTSAGDYSVQVAAFYAEDSANALVQKMRAYGDATVVKEGDMFKVRIVNLDAPSARRVIDTLRSNEGMAPGLLKNGRWINADSI
ncbi:MAG: septal ring lytic transglycosylase RlpA family protein [Alphaproteobacteria bacterium]|nr:septal ring lytic transglycosylase RlpA family protein [Alphaproteobacteria bacterium]